MDIGRIKARMEALGLSESDVAREAGLADYQLQKIFEHSDSFPQRFTDSLASVLLCSSDYLSGTSDDIGERDDFGSRIKRLRYQKKMTSEQLAEKIGLFPFLEKRVENNEMSFMDRAPAIAKALGVTENQLINQPDIGLKYNAEIKTVPESPILPDPPKIIPETVENDNPSADRKENALNQNISTFDNSSPTFEEADIPENFKTVATEPSVSMEYEDQPIDASDGNPSTEIDRETESPGKVRERFAFIRKKSGLSYSEIAKSCNVSTSLIRSIESGTANPKAGTLERIAEALGSSCIFLFSGSNTADPDEGAGYESIAAAVKSLREAKDWNIPRLARESGVSKSTISSIESGADTNIEIFRKLAVALGCPVVTLLRHVKAAPLQPSSKAHNEAVSAHDRTTDSAVQKAADVDNAFRKVSDSLEELKAEIEKTKITEEEREIITAYRGLSDTCKEEFGRTLKFLSTVSGTASS